MSKDATEQVNVKLSDYGISSYLNAQGMFGTEGTPGFQAPEILKNMVYNEKVYGVKKNTSQIQSYCDQYLFSQVIASYVVFSG